VRPGCEQGRSHEQNARIDDISTRVLRALRHSGRRKLATPLEIASSPVSDEPPVRVSTQQGEKGQAHQDARALLAQVVTDEQVVGGWARWCSDPVAFFTYPVMIVRLSIVT